MTGSPPAETNNVQASMSGLTACTGLELVSRLADGTLRPPSMAETLPFTLLPPEEGKIELRATPEARFCNLTNTIHGGWTMTMLDTAMSLAAQTTLSPGEICPSLETSAKFVRPISIHSGVMHVTGYVVARGRTVITLEGRIENAEGKIHAHGTSSCMIIPRNA
ncbi:MAG: PaaI family thioesterase [Pseudomonadota bacterium]